MYSFLGIKYPKPMKVFKKIDKPVLKPDPNTYWRSKAVFNPAVYIDKDDRIKMIYRAVGEYYRYISRLGLAVSEDGYNFRYIGNDPVMIPTDEDEWWGVEDPRISLIGDKLILTYTKWDRVKTLVGFAEVVDKGDYVEVVKLGKIVEPKNDKNAVIIEVERKQILIHRPWDWGREKEPNAKPSIWCSPFKGYIGETTYSVEDSWILYKTPYHMIKSGIGPPPIKLDNNEWLVFIHIVYPPEIYLIYAMLVDKEFKKILSVTPQPILAPEHGYEWELYGDVPFVVFPTGAIVRDNEVYLYYGAGDKVVMLAKADLSELLMVLDKYRGKVLAPPL